eukprot:COSAG05_NODE_1276_length_5305_cov_7.675759_1_plen_116_part_00
MEQGAYVGQRKVYHPGASDFHSDSVTKIMRGQQQGGDSAAILHDSTVATAMSASPGPSTTQGTGAFFEMLDVNKDGQISVEEFKALDVNRWAEAAAAAARTITVATGRPGRSSAR